MTAATGIDVDRLYGTCHGSILRGWYFAGWVRPRFAFHVTADVGQEHGAMQCKIALASHGKIPVALVSDGPRIIGLIGIRVSTAPVDTVTLTGYYEYVGTPLAKADADGYVGARPYVEGLKAWIERVPGFSTDKITAEVLFQPADPCHLLGIWDMYAAMVDQGKPVELQYIRGGEHNIRKPLEVFAHQEMIVDWFDFWLNAHGAADPSKEAQYARWRLLRKLRESAIATAP